MDEKEKISKSGINWEEYDKRREEQRKKTEKRWEEIQERRKQEDEIVSKMTDEELSKYMKDIYRKVNEKASMFKEVKTIEINESEEE